MCHSGGVERTRKRVLRVWAIGLPIVWALGTCSVVAAVYLTEDPLNCDVCTHHDLGVSLFVGGILSQLLTPYYVGAFLLYTAVDYGHTMRTVGRESTEHRRLLHRTTWAAGAGIAILVVWTVGL